MPDLRIQLFGRFEVVIEGEQSLALDSGRAQELLAYLLINRDRPHSRESLAELFWDASSTSQAKKYLRQTLWQLQQWAEKAGAGSLVQIEPEWVRVNPGADFWLDVAEFERAFEAARGVPGHELTPELAEAVESAIACYRDDLMEGLYVDWCLFERERLQNMWISMLDKLMSYFAAAGDFDAGLSYGMKILRKDRAREQTHRRLMRIAFLAGDRTGALRQYERCVTALHEELGVAPSQRTQALHKQILEDAPVLLPPRSMDLASLPDRLEQVRTALTQLRRRISDDIDALDEALADPK